MQTPFNPNPRDCGGPENSLNLWGEGSRRDVLADYGNAYSLMLYLHDQYGADMMRRLHQDGDLQGLPSLEAALDRRGRDNMYRVLHDFQTSTLVDKIVGERGRHVPGRAEVRGHHAEPARDGEPRQPGRRTTSRAPPRTARTTSCCRRRMDRC